MSGQQKQEVQLSLRMPIVLLLCSHMHRSHTPSAVKVELM